MSVTRRCVTTLEPSAPSRCRCLGMWPMADATFPRPGVDAESVEAWLTQEEHAGERAYRSLVDDLSASRREVCATIAEIDRLNAVIAATTKEPQ